ncbi:hypothetical protein CA13_39480 [Planctomycetes bacterium CA13]|uniref:Uncharacterized protein n=1 Tax=Novipirellula herctigrandis TaxID=2527986 RepID=A0A5C5Z5K6_9BACT|nr:hypothetical protein CA13_39480 [Planctomycetes bacterium CA13]
MSQPQPQPVTAECRFESNDCDESAGTLYIKVLERLIAIPTTSRLQAHQMLGSDELVAILRDNEIEAVDGYFWGDQGCCGF